MHLRANEVEELRHGALAPSSVQRFEMHLLICHRCQDRLADMDLFVAAMRAASGQVRAGTASPAPSSVK